MTEACLFAYDLVGADRDHEPLFAELERRRAQRILGSMWVVPNTNDPVDLVNSLTDAVGLDPDDRLLALRIDEGDCCGRNVDLLAHPDDAGPRHPPDQIPRIGPTLGGTGVSRQRITLPR